MTGEDKIKHLELVLEAAEKVIDSIPDGPSLDSPDMMVALAGLKGEVEEYQRWEENP